MKMNKKETSLKDKFYKQIKLRLELLISKGVEVKFNIYKPISYPQGSGTIGLLIMETNEAPKFPKNLTINLWDSNSNIMVKLSKIEDELMAWEEYTETNFYKLKKHFEDPINQQ